MNNIDSHNSPQGRFVLCCNDRGENIDFWDVEANMEVFIDKIVSLMTEYRDDFQAEEDAQHSKNCNELVSISQYLIEMEQSFCHSFHCLPVVMETKPGGCNFFELDKKGKKAVIEALRTDNDAMFFDCNMLNNREILFLNFATLYKKIEAFASRVIQITKQNSSQEEKMALCEKIMGALKLNINIERGREVIESNQYQIWLKEQMKNILQDAHYYANSNANVWVTQSEILDWCAARVFELPHELRQGKVKVNLTNCETIPALHFVDIAHEQNGAISRTKTGELMWAHNGTSVELTLKSAFLPERFDKIKNEFNLLLNKKSLEENIKKPDLPIESAGNGYKI